VYRCPLAVLGGREPQLHRVLIGDLLERDQICPSERMAIRRDQIDVRGRIPRPHVAVWGVPATDEIYHDYLIDSSGCLHLNPKQLPRDVEDQVATAVF
jgi:hypothetical protein